MYSIVDEKNTLFLNFEEKNTILGNKTMECHWNLRNARIKNSTKLTFEEDLKYENLSLTYYVE